MNEREELRRQLTDNTVLITSCTTGESRIVNKDDIGPNVSWEMALKQRRIPGIKAQSISEMTEEEFKLFMEMQGE